MAALTGTRNTTRLGGFGPIVSQNEYPVAAGVICYQGAMLSFKAGVVRPAITETGAQGVGECERFVDNSLGAAGAKVVIAREGAWGYVNSPDDGDRVDTIGVDCYMVDDQTVAKTNGGATRSVAGKVVKLDGDVVYVDLRRP